MQRDKTLGIEDLLSIVHHDFKAGLKDVLPVHLRHVGLERLLIPNLLRDLPVLHGKVDLCFFLLLLTLRLVQIDTLSF